VKENIQQEISVIPRQELHHVSRNNFFFKMWDYIEAGQHFEMYLEVWYITLSGGNGQQIINFFCSVR
jgi:hypothetical protein